MPPLRPSSSDPPDSPDDRAGGASPEFPASPLNDRYLRQRLLARIGNAGQDRLARSHALIVGCGALGCAVADGLVRAGVGRLTIADRDVVERSNLHRQTLFCEADADQQLPKAVAARQRLLAVNRDVEIEAIVADVNASNIREIGPEAQLIIDGLDNFETRYLLNDLAVATSRPLVHAGVVGTTATALTVLPLREKRAEGAEQNAPPPSTNAIAWTADQSTPCIRCLFPDPPTPGTMPTCETAGVLGPAVSFIAAHQAAEAIKLMTGAVDAIDRTLWSVDLWSNELRRLDVSAARDPDCPCCGRRRFDFLDGRSGALTSSLCGRDAVQVIPADPPRADDPPDRFLDLRRLADHLAPHGAFTVTPFLLRGRLHRESSEPAEVGDGALELTVFPDGRAIIHGTDDLARARTVYARYIGL